MNEGPFCTCKVINFDPEDLGGFRYRDRWTCKDCGSEFGPRAYFDSLMEQTKDELFTQQDIDEAYASGLLAGKHEMRSAVLKYVADKL